MANINCHTNIDCAKRLKWPTYLPERPFVGDLIRSTSSTSRHYVELQVCSCTWVCVKGGSVETWFLDVELHLPHGRFENITAFEHWMEKM